MPSNEKYCPDCKTVKSIGEFAISDNSDDLYFPICKVCASKRYQAQMAKYHEYFPTRNVGLADFVRTKCHDAIWRGKNG